MENQNMDNLVYRFRSIEQLLESHQELENQQVYFAKPEQLNDPLEGLKDIFWSGDEVIWKNLIKHYLLCLDNILSLAVLTEEDVYFSKEQIPVRQVSEPTGVVRWQNRLQFNHQNLLKNKVIANLIKWLSKDQRRIRKNELSTLLKMIHFIVLDDLYQSYEKHHLRDEGSQNDFIQKMAEHQNNVGKKFEAIFEVESPPDGWIETIFEVLVFTNYQMEIIQEAQEDSVQLSKRLQMLFYDFTDLYIKQLPTLLYPDWYTACFSKNYNNASLWGYYADSHAGVCLQFKMHQDDQGAMLRLKKQFHKLETVKYEEKYPEIDFFRSFGQLNINAIQTFWYKDENGLRSCCAEGIFENIDEWREKHWENLIQCNTTKLIDWKYEEEYRLIIVDILSDKNSTEARQHQYDFEDLDGIIFGINTKSQDIQRIIKIISQKCEIHQRTEFNFYQARYSETSGKIEKKKMSLLKFS